MIITLPFDTKPALLIESGIFISHPPVFPVSEIFSS